MSDLFGVETVHNVRPPSATHPMGYTGGTAPGETSVCGDLEKNARSLRPQTEVQRRWTIRKVAESAATAAGMISVSSQRLDTVESR
jgi:hypothetical protein